MLFYHQFYRRGFKTMIQEFFAVTMNSVYRVRADGGDGNISVEKIASRGYSKIAVGEKLQGGTMLAICKWLQMYFPEVSGWD